MAENIISINQEGAIAEKSLNTQSGFLLGFDDQDLYKFNIQEYQNNIANLNNQIQQLQANVNSLSEQLKNQKTYFENEINNLHKVYYGENEPNENEGKPGDIYCRIIKEGEI